ncbi:MAG: hypothetical protein ACJKSS_01785 [Patescibacteria group bacterium UBA2103]
MSNAQQATVLDQMQAELAGIDLGNYEINPMEDEGFDSNRMIHVGPAPDQVKRLIVLRYLLEKQLDQEKRFGHNAVEVLRNLGGDVVATVRAVRAMKDFTEIDEALQNIADANERINTLSRKLELLNILTQEELSCHFGDKISRVKFQGGEAALMVILSDWTVATMKDAERIFGRPADGFMEMLHEAMGG